MKKLLFVLAFTFIGQQGFSQIYIAMLTEGDFNNPSGCSDYVLTKIDPVGNVTYDCISDGSIGVNPTPLVELNIGLNSIINQGYKLIEIKKPSIEFQHSLFQGTAGSFLQGSITYNIGTTWYFAIP